jgi:acyl-CoA thioesterase YciA
MVFLKPVYVGDTVCCYAELVKVGRTSMQFKIEVWTVGADVDLQTKVAEGNFTFVALDDNNRPQPVNR